MIVKELRELRRIAQNCALTCITSIAYAFASDAAAVSVTTTGSSTASSRLARRTGSLCATRVIRTREPPASSTCTPRGVCERRMMCASVPTSCTCSGSATVAISTVFPSSSARGRKTAMYGWLLAFAATSAAAIASCVTSHGW